MTRVLRSGAGITPASFVPAAERAGRAARAVDTKPRPARSRAIEHRRPARRRRSRSRGPSRSRSSMASSATEIVAYGRRVSHSWWRAVVGRRCASGAIAGWPRRGASPNGRDRATRGARRRRHGAGRRTSGSPFRTTNRPTRSGELAAARRGVDDARGRLEVAVGLEYRSAHPTRGSSWMARLPRVPHGPATLGCSGVVEEPPTLPFRGDDLEATSGLPAGHRTSVFARVTAHGRPGLRSWALRLWPWEGKDLLHGLVRVEAAPVNGTTALADRLSRWLLAERAPVSAPDPRWDRMLYGMRSVEEFLDATA